MNTPREIVEMLEFCSQSPDRCWECKYESLEGDLCVNKVLGDARDLILDMMAESKEGPKPLRYWTNITAMNERQEAKGRGKYGQDLEDNDTLTTTQRIEHAQEEAIDLLKYLEHLKQVVNDGMTANDYQRAAMRTAWTKTKQEVPPKIMALLESGAMTEHELLLLNGALGMGGESGEVLDLIKKNIFHGHELDIEEVAEEIGDVAWYVAVASHAIGYTLGDIFQMNVDKLMKRYPDGFDKARSINREEENV